MRKLNSSDPKSIEAIDAHELRRRYCFRYVFIGGDENGLVLGVVIGVSLPKSESSPEEDMIAILS
jgi:hypothetical protein